MGIALNSTIMLKATGLLPEAGSAALASDGRHLSAAPLVRQRSISSRRQTILYITSEISDYVKAGGLGEVSAACPQ